MLLTIGLVMSLIFLMVAAAGADFETLHRAAREHSGWWSIGPAAPTIPATLAADAKSHTIYVGSLGGGVITFATVGCRAN
jgi:hypothetical protein